MTGTSEVVRRLKKDGFEVSHSYLAYMVREEIIAPPAKGPGGAFVWSHMDELRLRGQLIRRSRGPRDEQGSIS